MKTKLKGWARVKPVVKKYKTIFGNYKERLVAEFEECEILGFRTDEVGHRCHLIRDKRGKVYEVWGHDIYL